MIELLVAALVISGAGLLVYNNAVNDTMTEGMAQAGRARVGD